MSDLQRIESAFGSVPEYFRQLDEHEERLSEPNDIIAAIPMSLPFSECEQSVKDILENATELAFYTIPLTVEDEKYNEKFRLYKLNDDLYEIYESEVLREITIKRKKENDVFKFYSETIRIDGGYISDDGYRYIKELIDARIPDVKAKGLVFDSLHTSNIEIALMMDYGYQVFVTLGGDSSLSPALKDNIHAFITAHAFDQFGKRVISVSLENIPVNIDMFGRITANPAPCLQALYDKINKDRALSKAITYEVTKSKSIDYTPSKYKHYFCEYNIDGKMKQSLEFAPNVSIKEVTDHLSERCLTAAGTDLNLSDINIYEIVPYQEPQLIGTMEAMNAVYVPIKSKADVDKIQK